MQKNSTEMKRGEDLKNLPWGFLKNTRKSKGGSKDVTLQFFAYWRIKSHRRKILSTKLNFLKQTFWGYFWMLSRKMLIDNIWRVRSEKCVHSEHMLSNLQTLQKNSTKISYWRLLSILVHVVTVAYGTDGQALPRFLVNTICNSQVSLYRVLLLYYFSYLEKPNFTRLYSP